MPKIKIKTIFINLLIFLFLCSPLSGLLVRFSLFTKKITLPNGSTKLQRVVLCGDNHIIGTPLNNARQWYTFLDQLKQYKNSPITILVENQHLSSLWFNDTIDKKLEKILHQDITFCLKSNEPGSLTMLSLIGLPANFFPTPYRSTVKNLNIINIECRQFLCYTALLNKDALRQNIFNPSLIAPVKKLQEQKIKTLTLNDVFKPTMVIDSYKNNSTDKQVRMIFTDIKQRITNNWNSLTDQWKKKFPDLKLHQPIANLRSHYLQSHGMMYNGYTVYKIVNPFEEDLCISLITSQFMDEMIEANALWHITKSDAADTIITLVGSTHSGHIDIVKVANTLADHLLELGYKHITSFGLEDIHNVDAFYCEKVSREIPRRIFLSLKN